MTYLASYVKEKIDAARQDYDDVESLINDASHGIASGWWSDLIYYSDIIERFQVFKLGIKEAMKDYAECTGEEEISNGFTAGQIVEAFLATPEEIRASEDLTMAVVWLVSFGIEWETHKYGNQLMDDINNL